MARKRADRYHHGDLSRSLLQEALRTIQKDGRRRADDARRRREARRVAHGALSPFRRQVGAAGGGRDRRIPHPAPADAGRVGDARRRPRGVRSDGRGLRAVCRRAPLALSRDVRRIRARCRPDSDLAKEGAGAFQVLVDALVAQQQQGLVRRRQPACARAIHLGERARHRDARDRRPVEAADRRCHPLCERADANWYKVEASGITSESRPASDHTATRSSPSRSTGTRSNTSDTISSGPSAFLRSPTARCGRRMRAAASSASDRTDRRT